MFFFSFFRSKIIIVALSAILMVWPSNIRAENKNKIPYPEFGITTSSLILHPSIGYWWGRKGLRFTGMYLNNDHQEFHINLGYELYGSNNVQQSINLLTSWIAGSYPGQIIGMMHPV